MTLKNVKSPGSRVRLKNKQEHFYSQVVALIQGISALLGIGLTHPEFVRPGRVEPLQLIGLITLVPSLVLWTVARIQLGRCCTLLPDARALVTTGLYSKIRNPVYIFGTSAVFSYFLVLNRSIFLCFLIVVIPVQYCRARQEAALLELQFGDTYRKYVAGVWL